MLPTVCPAQGLQPRVLQHSVTGPPGIQQTMQDGCARFAASTLLGGSLDVASGVAIATLARTARRTTGRMADCVSV